MPLVDLFLVLLVAAFVYYVLNNVLGRYIGGPFLNLMNAVLVFVVVIYVLFWVLGVVGFVHMPTMFSK